MSTGTVKWFDDAKGFGFIQPEDGSKDVLVHSSASAGDGPRSLSECQQVALATTPTQKGLAAAKGRLAGTPFRAA